MLEEIRGSTRKTAPKATEKISYGIPFYEHHGRLIYFAAWKSYVSLYPLGDAEVAYARELEGYRAAKSTARFPLDEPLPGKLIEKLVKARVKEQEVQAKAG